jgi:hypothetical protein
MDARPHPSIRFPVIWTMAISAPTCPRCGYDLSGAIAAWPDASCPLEGTCSECGLSTPWRNILNPDYATSEHFFETAKHTKARAFLVTWWRSLRPRSLWSSIHMHFQVSAPRLALFLLLSMVLEWAVGAAILFPFFYETTRTWGTPGESLALAARASFWPIHDDSDWWGIGSRHIQPWTATIVAWTCATPAMFSMVPQTLRRAHVRWGHLVRVAAYSLVGLPLVVYLPGLLHQVIAHTLQWIQPSIWPFALAQMVRSFWVYLALCAVWLGLCWNAACRLYLRLDRPRLVAFTVLGIAMLAIMTTAAVAACFSHDALEWLVDELA